MELAVFDRAPDTDECRRRHVVVFHRFGRARFNRRSVKDDNGVLVRLRYYAKR